jgi:2-methylcitrate dehydratase PrpD
VLDTLACMIAGFAAPPLVRLARALADIQSGIVLLPGTSARLAPLDAAALAAIAACWDEACEGSARAHGRPGVPVIAAAISLGLARDATFDDLLDAVIVGYEVGARMGEQLRIKTGMHADAGWPALGVAAAISRLLRLDPDRARDAIEIAAMQLPFGLYLPIEQGADGRNTYLGHAAWLGIYAALSAAAGIAAPRGAIQGHAAIALGREKPIDFADNEADYILEAYLKPFAAVRHVHYGAQAGLELRSLIGNTRTVRGITLKVYREAVAFCSNRAPRTPIQAQFSLSFGVAATLRFGALGPEVYRAPMFGDSELARLESLTRVEEDESLTAAGERGATLALELANGRRIERKVTTLKGERDAPFTRADGRSKFMQYTSATLGDAEASRIATQVLGVSLDTPLRAVLLH